MAKLTQQNPLFALTGHVNARSKANLSIPLYQSARRMTELANRIEQRHATTLSAVVSDQDLADHRAYVLGAAIMATAALEASINEFFGAIEDHNRTAVGAVLQDARSARALCRLWPDLGRTPILNKYQAALILCDAARIGQDTRLYQDAASLVDFRNALVHFKAEWDDRRKIQARLEKRLKSRFEANPLVPPQTQWIHRCLSAGCAKWACETVCAFNGEFCNRLGIPKQFN